MSSPNAAADSLTGTNQRGGQVSRLFDHPHTLAATSGGRLDQHRVTDLVGGRDQFIVGESGPCDPGNDGHAELRHGALGGDLVAHGLNRADRRTDERHPRRCQRCREISVLREKSVTRVDGLSSGAHGRVDDRRDVEVAVTRGRRTDCDRQVGRGDMAGGGVGIAVDGHRPDAHRLQCADHPDGDLTPVGDQNSIEAHRITS